MSMCLKCGEEINRSGGGCASLCPSLSKSYFQSSGIFQLWRLWFSITASLRGIPLLFVPRPRSVNGCVGYRSPAALCARHGFASCGHHPDISDGERSVGQNLEPLVLVTHTVAQSFGHKARFQRPFLNPVWDDGDVDKYILTL